MSTLGFVDEYVLIDTSPGNNENEEQLKDLTRFFKATVVQLPRPDPLSFNYSQARNTALSASHKKWILRLDADEILHEDTILPLLWATQTTDCVGIETMFYHHMIKPSLHQLLDDPKILLFRREGARWMGRVHERISLHGSILKMHDIRFNHYGYCRGQREVMKRWKLYENIEGKKAWYHDSDPDHILDERLDYIIPYEHTHPVVVIPTLQKLFPEEDL
jgi:glycosyltransferase involved in cell wall biosynthesis